MPAYSFQAKPVYLIDAVRTPVGSPFKSLKDFSAAQLGGVGISALIGRTRLDPSVIDEVVLGNTVLAGGGQNPARQASLIGQLLVTTPAYTVSSVCSAGMQAIISAGQSIALGAANGIIAGGSESASRTPLMFSKLVETPFSARKPVDSLLYDGLWCSLSGKPMGELAETLAKKAKISRAAQDQYALESHQKAAAAVFSEEIVKIVMEKNILGHDERVRRRLSMENFKSLSPAFAERGTVTAGNASVPSDGAAVVLLGGKNFTADHKIKPFGRILGYASIAAQPLSTFTAGVDAVKSSLKVCNLKLKDIGLFEISEAFACQAIYTRSTLRIPEKTMNIHGGDLALGHPLGAAGSRIVVTLAHAMKTHNKKYGLAAICYGGGGAMAVIIENLK